MHKHYFFYRKARYRGLKRNALDMCLMLIACNLKQRLWLGIRLAGIGVDPVLKKV